MKTYGRGLIQRQWQINHKSFLQICNEKKKIVNDLEKWFAIDILSVNHQACFSRTSKTNTQTFQAIIAAAADLELLTLPLVFSLISCRCISCMNRARCRPCLARSCRWISRTASSRLIWTVTFSWKHTSAEWLHPDSRLFWVTTFSWKHATWAKWFPKCSSDSEPLRSKKKNKTKQKKTKKKTNKTKQSNRKRSSRFSTYVIHEWSQFYQNYWYPSNQHPLSMHEHYKHLFTSMIRCWIFIHKRSPYVWHEHYQ